MLATAPTKWNPTTHTETGPNNGGGPAEQHRQAQLLANETRARLVRVREALPAPATAARAAGGTATLERLTTLDPEAQAMLDRLRVGNAHDATAAVDPLPRPIEPRKTRQPNQPGPERGVER